MRGPFQFQQCKLNPALKTFFFVCAFKYHHFNFFSQSSYKCPQFCILHLDLPVDPCSQQGKE